jgi:WD40 repeat protein
MGFGEEGDLWWWYDQGNGGEAVKRAQMAADGSVKIGLAYSTTAIGVPTAVNLVPWGIVSMEGQRKSAFQPFGPWFLRAHVLGTNQVYASEPLIPDGSGRANEIVMNVVRSPDGRYLVALADEEATLLGLPSMKIIKRFDTHYNRSAAFSCSSALVAIATGSDGIFVWQTATGNPVRRISLYGTSLSLGFASGQSSMVFVGENALYPGSSPICRVDVNTGRVTALSDLHASVLLVSRSGERLYAGTQEGGVYVLELPVPDRPRSGDSGSAGS